MVETADALVIGAGLAGLSCAARIADERRVIVLETEAQPGQHASGRSAAIFAPNYADAPIRELTRRSRPFFDAGPSEDFPEPLLAPRGLLRLVSNEGAQSYEAAMGDAVGIENVSLDEARRLFPILRPERFIAASFEEDVHDIDAHAMLQGWRRRISRSGGVVACARRVDALARRDGLWRAQAGDAAYAAPILVNAAGAWADEIARLAGVPPLGLRPLRRSVAILPTPDAFATAPSPAPFTVPFPLRWYAKAEASALLVSAAEEDEVPPQDAFTDDMALAEGLHRFEEDTTHRVTRVQGSWAGLRTYAPDGHPVVGFDATVDGFFWLAGQGGFGAQTAPALAELAATRLACSADDDGQSEDFRPDRFRTRPTS